MRTINDKIPNFRGSNGNLYLIRCYNCDKDCGRENYTCMVAVGQCNWCGWVDNLKEITTASNDDGPDTAA